MGLWEKLTNWVMPQEEIYEDEESLEASRKG